VYSRPTVPRPVNTSYFDFASVPLSVPDRPSVPQEAEGRHFRNLRGRGFLSLEPGETDPKRFAHCAPEPSPGLIPARRDSPSEGDGVRGPSLAFRVHGEGSGSRPRQLTGVLHSQAGRAG
jgi:hypothetical protein